MIKTTTFLLLSYSVALTAYLLTRISFQSFSSVFLGDPLPTYPWTKMDAIVCFGDSITQGAWVDGGVGSVLGHLYQRKLDVMNRGLSGYNTKWAIPIMKKSITREEFKANLHQIIDFLADPKSEYYSPSTKFLLITPPPIDEQVRANALASRDPPQPCDRDTARTKSFADAVTEVGIEKNVAVVDAWTAITEAARIGGGLGRYLSDGLHLTSDGYRVVDGAVGTAIATHLPELHWDALPQVYPHWTDYLSASEKESGPPIVPIPLPEKQAA